MANAEVALNLLAAMIDDIGSLQYFEKGGPLGWFSLTRTYAAIAKKGYVSDKQLELIEHVRRVYTNLRSACKRFQEAPVCHSLLRVLQEVQKAKPKAVSARDRGRNQRLAKVVHAMTPGGVLHMAHFDEAECVVGEIGVSNRVTVWTQIHAARLHYLCCLYGDKNPEWDVESFPSSDRG